MQTTTFKRAIYALLLLLPTGAFADRNINFQSTFEVENMQSDGSPLDATFTFAFGSFGDFDPAANDPSTWFDNWTLTPNSNTSPFSGSMVSYSTANVPFGGPANAFQGFVTLNTNSGDFAAGSQAYFWGYNSQTYSETSEWVLLTNDSWLFPAIAPGEVEINDVNWTVSDAGTYAVVGGVNPEFDPDGGGSQLPHISTALMPIPEPDVMMLGAFALALCFRRQR